MSLFDKALDALPHGPEFRFLDHLLSLTPGRDGVAEYRIRGDEPFLRGHFPGSPLFPGVLLVEACAQLAGVVAQSDPRFAPLADLKLTAVRSAKIVGSAAPGEILRLRAEVTGRLGNLVQADVNASAGDRLLLEGSLTLSGRSSPAHAS